MSHFLLCDNQDLTRLALQTLIDKDSREHTIKVAPDKTELLHLLKSEPESIVVLDYTLFDFNDVESLIICCERFVKSRWILISDELTDEFLRKVVYSVMNVSVVLKDEPLSVVQSAFSAAISGQRYISQRLMEIILDHRRTDEPQNNLTPTEIEILRLIAQGKTSKEIAAERVSSVHTITTHRKNIFFKLNVNTAHEAIKYALRAGLVDPSEFYI